ncbi:MAG: transcription-repair coupling factor [Deltaproteobacteria bacterium]|nr:transcription-repair coupling factor [Deltaproteobacteria bacterium]
MTEGRTIADAIRGLADAARAAGARARVFGLRGGAPAYFVSRLLAEAPTPSLVIVASVAAAEEWLRGLRFFVGEDESVPPLERRVHWLPPWDTEPLSGVSPTEELVAERLSTLHQLNQAKAPIVVTTADALAQRVPPRRALLELSPYWVEGEEIGFERVAERLVRGGYHRVAQVEDRGEFAVRGGIVDVYPAVAALPLRLQFDGDVLEAIRAFDPATQCSLGRWSEVLITPWREYALERWTDPAVRRAIETRADDLDVARPDRLAALDRMEAGLAFPGSAFLLPFLHPALETVADYCPAGLLFWLDRPAAVEEAEEAFARSLAAHAAAAAAARRLVPRADELYLEPAALRAQRGRFATIELDPIEMLAGEDARHGVMRVKSFVTTDLGVPSPGRGRETSIRPLVERLSAWERDAERVVLVAHDRAQANRLKGLLAVHELEVPILDRRFRDLPSDARRMIVLGDLAAGFHLPADRLAVVTEEEIFGERRRRRGRALDVGKFLASLAELKPDDFVVHVDHGIGRYKGLRHLTVADTEGDYLHLEYQGGDRLYVPVDRINVVEKYVGADGSAPELDKLGGTSWEKVKAKTRQAVLEMAHELLAIYAAREVMEGRSFRPPDEYFREFEARFPFEETPDQERAIAEVLADLQRARPMDRLVCGDVGFGKTEVALRAAFTVVMEGKQVLLMVPTTVLAQQHFETFQKRFAGFPVRIELLSRFRKGEAARAVLKAMARGEVDIVIGTHRLLQSDVELKDLGLLVIDEEHRFGVAHKEKIKSLRKLVDVLTLTATPIPRTLSMALSGIRDLSIIESPPVDRQAIRTYVTRYDESLIREATLRELGRGGQVFFVHNRVETIDRAAARLRELLPEARIGVAHGQMHGSALEKVMLDFLEKRIDVLVTTAIIESGLDIPNANTIFIDRADHFGLAQLYQLRGRVGRSHQRAYAYLLLPGESFISRDAQKRLEVLASLDDLGGGFRLAVHDLEIRGAGNLLGKQQSGQVAAVGFELYTQMLEEAIRELRGERRRVDVEPEIQLGIAAFIPEDYVADVGQRLALYKRMARAESREELDELAGELEDRFGPVPARVGTLLDVMDLRRHLKRAMVLRLRRQGGRLVLRFHEASRVDPQRVVALARARRDLRLLPENEVAIAVDHIDLAGIARAVLGLLRELGAVEAVAVDTAGKTGQMAPLEVRS